MADKDKVVVQFEVLALGERVHAMMLDRAEEIHDLIEEGVEQAAKTAADEIVKRACEEATRQINEQIKRYFEYGPGREAIKTAIETALKPLSVALMTGTSRKK